MKKILLLVITALFAVSTSLSLEPMKVAFIYTAGGPINVHVQLANSVDDDIFVGETFSLNPNGSGIVIVNVEDYAGSGTDWADVDADDVTTYHTIDIYVGTTLYAQYRLDGLIINQAQTTVFDNNGNFNPSTANSTLGTDGNRWDELFVDGSTVHIGPAWGMADDKELAFSYDDGTNTATMTVAGKDVMDATDEVVTFNKLVSQEIGNNNTAFGTGALVSNTGINVTASGYFSASQNTGHNVTASGYFSAYQNTGGNVTASGVNSARGNTGDNVTASGDNSANGNSGNFVTASGYASANGNSGNYVTATGYFSAYLNEGDNVTASGYQSAYQNTGDNVTASGYQSAYQNTGDDVLALGNEAGISNGMSNVTIFSNSVLPSYADRAAAVAAITLGNGAVAGNTYMYYNVASNSIEAVRLP